MSWIMILVVSHAVTHIDFNTKEACEVARSKVIAEAERYGEHWVIVCAPKGQQ